MASDMEVRTKQRRAIDFLHAEKIAPSDIHRRLSNVYGDQTVDVSTLLNILQLNHSTKEEALLQLGGNNGTAKAPKCYVYVHISYLVQCGGILGLN